MKKHSNKVVHIIVKFDAMRPKPLQPLLKEKKLSWLRSILALACLLLTASPLFAQTKTVTGTVTDAQNEPLIGVSVLIQGTAYGI